MNGPVNSSVMRRRRRTRITSLQNEEGKWCELEQKVENEICGLYKKLFTSSQPIEFEAATEGVPCTITNEMNAALIKPVEEMEVENALFSMHPDKAPGPDSMTPLFFFKILETEIV